MSGRGLLRECWTVVLIRARASTVCVKLLMTFGSSDPTLQVLCLRKSISKGARKFGPRIAPPMDMDYEKMKALMETNREEPAVQRKPQVTEFPKPDSEPDWTKLGYDLIKGRIAA